MDDAENTPPLRILMLNHNLRGRGTWHRAWQLARGLARRGHAVTLWTAAPHHYYRAERERRDDVWIVETPSWAPLADGDDGWGPLDIAWRCGAILRAQFDLCHCFAHPPNVYLPTLLARAIRRRPIIYDWCDWYAGGIFPKRQEALERGLTPHSGPLARRLMRCEIGLERRQLERADRVTVISDFLREQALAAGRDPSNVLLLPNGANLDGVFPRERDACRRELGIARESLGDGPLLGYVANYHPDQEFFLTAFARACETLPTLRLLVGGPPFAPGLAERLGVADRIVALGPVPPERVGLALGAADALVLPLEDHPSNVARVPFKFTDYLASGRPIVTNAVGEMGRYFGVEMAEIGVATAPDPDAFASGMREIALAPPERRAAMGAAARALAEREFDWQRLAERFEVFARELVR